MNLKDFEYVKAIAHYKHFRKAADACFVSQPTLSGQVKKLEQELGVVLFDRSTKQVTLTSKGARLLAQIELILEQTQILKELAATSNEPLQGKLTIGIIPTIAPYLLPALLTSMKAAFIDSQFSFIEMQTATILEALNNGELDFAILADVPELINYHTVALYKEDFLVAVSQDNALSKHKKVALSDLQGCSLLMLSDGHCFKDQAQKFCFSAGVDVSNQYKGNSLETLLALVAMDDGITFVPKLACTERAGIDYMPIFPNQQRNVVFACRKHYPHLSGVEQLGEWLSAHPNLKAKLTKKVN
ncbi:LysR substrate-binding domain-containing protein [Pseudoalteromonas fuliginea]|uniref:LysR substrate-binding domain-containing protein n=1 Tax=Pseudoalteromonas TaxID=53246 RepID=UPI0002315519|nr:MULTISPECIES: LysR substrate-binding domain-containing protein [unclassified Pseudoalteromonas]ALQ08990.1 hyalorunate lyase [Pseudoalteromonas sp. Bsw20308]ATG76819.1 hyalorunate lyase [Pseudoalteromonas sp. 1_2015MBL_MicDiv]MDQ2043062.1 LysR substrate-binding domain-containing protein [Pseudoalteromonas sp. 20-92]GAA78602.1 LysR family transcriptional regulator, hydrogen peroxide-inducible genes activator [Pseudoalteromonas sp. BSi20495]